MRFPRVWPTDAVSPVKCKDASSCDPYAEREGVFSVLERTARQNGIFAISEISKGLVILVTGDMVTADSFGEFIGVMEQVPHSVKGLGHLAWVPAKSVFLLVGRVQISAASLRGIAARARI